MAVMVCSRAFSLCLSAALALGACGSAVAETRARPVVHRAEAARPLGAFTPSLIDAPGLSLRPGATVDASQFRFTPSGKHAQSHAVTLGLRARPVTLPDATRGADQPAGYDLGMAVGTRGLALSGGMRRVDAGLAQRETVTLGLGYGQRDWTTTLRLGEEDGWARGAQAQLDRRYSVELGGAYALGPDVKLGAGVRYRLAPANTTLDSDAKATQDRSAFVGLGIAF